MSKAPDAINEMNQKAAEAAMNLTRLSIEQGERLLKLQFDAVSGMLSDGMKAARELSEVRDPQQWTARQQQNAQDMIARLTDYSRSVHEVVGKTQKEIGSVVEARLKAMGTQTTSLVDDMAKTAPPGSEPAFAAMKQTLNVANSLAETMARTAQQFADSAESAIKAAADATAKAGKTGKSGKST
jgi:phasin family protein